MKIKWLPRASVRRRSWLLEYFSVTLYVKYRYCGAPAHTLLDLTQNLVKILIWEHKTEFTHAAADCKQPVTACGHGLKHPYSAEKVWSRYGQDEVSFHHIHDVRALQLFRATGHTEAMGMSTAVKEIKLSTAEADFSPPWVSLRRRKDVREVLGPRPAVAEEPQASFPTAVGSRKGQWSEALAEDGWGSTTWVRGGWVLGQKDIWHRGCPAAWSRGKFALS